MFSGRKTVKLKLRSVEKLWDQEDQISLGRHT